MQQQSMSPSASSVAFIIVNAMRLHRRRSQCTAVIQSGRQRMLAATVMVSANK
jgi:hypothetical protein